MTDQKNVLFQKLEKINGLVPLNYSKAKLTFSNQMNFNDHNMVKFIKIDKLSTNSAVAYGPPKSISRVFNL